MDVKRHLALLVQVAGLAATGWVVWIVAVLPRLGRQPLAWVIGEALRHALVACLASAAITLGLYLLVARSGRSDALLGALRTSSVAVWFAPATLLLAELSPLALGAALVLVISTTRLLYLEWRSFHPDIADGIAPTRDIFELPRPPLRLKDLGPALIASLALEGGIVSVLAASALLAAVLFSLATAMLTLTALKSGAYEARSERSLPRAILGLALTVILAAGLTVGGLAGHIQHSGPGFRWPFQHGAGPVDMARALLDKLLNGKEQTHPGGRVAKIYMPPGNSAEIDDKSFPGIVLFPELKPRAKLTAPPPGWSRTTISMAEHEPSVIPFSGEYWMFRPPETAPPKKSYTRWGSPTTMSFRTTDHAVMTMEAHQKLEHAIELSCCSAIEMAISIADRYPSTITLELILIDGGVPQSLGIAAVPARADALLRFPIPAGAAIRRFDEIEVVFHRDAVRNDRSARVGIERFVLAR